MRQKKDKTWCDLLDRLRMSTLTKKDTDLLARRTFTKEKCDQIHAEMRLFPTVKMVENHNRTRQNELKETQKVFESTDIYSTYDNVGPGCAVAIDDLPVDNRKAGGLAQKLELSIGTRVMLTRNLLPDLCNGDQGYITAFEINLQNITTGILIKFDDANAGEELKDPEFDNNVKIERIDCEFMYKGRIIIRKQFPIMPSWSVTIHKAQGMSLNSAVVNVSNKIFRPGQTYVALSRIREISGLFIEDGIDLTKIKTNERVLQETEKWMQKWKELRKQLNKLKK
jgi:ATP-dependent exoDNAse (exonuclease V) alpha subunit